MAGFLSLCVEFEIPLTPTSFWSTARKHYIPTSSSFTNVLHTDHNSFLLYILILHILLCCNKA
ncbi:hypothetical protein KL86DES1_20603 [uncultured Desulfovibrio sp.]|uniref:Uncharacterized protein n=1 Tax=uncultured Desulfovibrio sp. TaxID=167968 RepID=A0A212L4D5_9BACT|nr:hypothetical protein KL86DES1_20603 [uncultured Desulfovibrio sp.]VZH33506.1 conserved protein of unknown function [Desulfovibrio sp. 86]